MRFLKILVNRALNALLWIWVKPKHCSMMYRTLEIILFRSFSYGVSDPAALEGSYAAEGLKKILLEIGQRYLPADFALRPKRGFNMPLADWLRGPLLGMVAETLDGNRLKRGGLFDPKYVQYVREHVEADLAPASDLWLLFVASLWSEQVLGN